jgi:cytokinesis protein
LEVGKLNVYRNAAPEELEALHLSDRLMVQLIKIDRLGPRLEGMVYRTKFEESFGLLEDVRGTLEQAQFID